MADLLTSDDLARLRRHADAVRRDGGIFVVIAEFDALIALAERALDTEEADTRPACPACGDPADVIGSGDPWPPLTNGDRLCCISKYTVPDNAPATVTTGVWGIHRTVRHAPWEAVE